MGQYHPRERVDPRTSPHGECLAHPLTQVVLTSCPSLLHAEVVASHAFFRAGIIPCQLNQIVSSL
jgi:hypothetical protein